MRNPARAIERADRLLTRGVELSRAGKHGRAEGHLREAIRLYRRVTERAGSELVANELRARHTGGFGMRWNMGVALWRLANVVAARGELGEAVSRCTEAADLMRMQVDLRDASVLDRTADSMRPALAVCLIDLSLFRSASDSPYRDEAVRAADEAVGLLVGTRGNDKELATAYHALALAHLEAGEARQADTAIRRALDLREPAAHAEPGASLAGYELSSSLLLRARILLATGNRLKAEAALDRAGDLIETLGPAGLPLVGELARLREQLGR